MDRLETLLDYLDRNLRQLPCQKPPAAVKHDLGNKDRVKIFGVNPRRRGMVICNLGSKPLLVSFSLTGPASLIVQPISHELLPFPMYTGEVFAVFQSSNGEVVVTELV